MRRISLSLIIGVVLAGVGTIAVAARNSSGTFALPSGNPVVSGTSISSVSFNGTMSELAQGITDSADRLGRGGFLAAVRGVNGTADLPVGPAFSFTSDNRTGLFLIGASNPAMSVAGTKRQEWSTAGTSVNGTLGTSGLATLNSASVTTTLGVTGAATLSSTLGVTGALTAATVATGGVAFIGAPGDIQSARTATPTAGYVQLGNIPSRYVGFDGTQYHMPGAPLEVATPVNGTDATTKTYVDTAAASAGGAAVYGRILSGTAGSCVTGGRGTPLATCDGSATGTYVVTVPSITTTATIVATICSSGLGFINVVPGTGTFTVTTRNSGGTLADLAPVCFAVMHL